MKESQQLPGIKAEPWDTYSDPHGKIYVMPTDFSITDFSFSRKEDLNQGEYNLNLVERSMIEKIFDISGVTYLNLVENNLIVVIADAYWWGEIEPQIAEVFENFGIGNLAPSDFLPLGEINEIVADLYSSKSGKEALFHVRKEISCSHVPEKCEQGKWENDAETHKRIGEKGSQLVTRLFEKKEGIEKIIISVYKVKIITKEKIRLKDIGEFIQDVERIMEAELAIG